MIPMKLVAALALLGSCLAVHAQVNRMEILSFETRSLSDQVFLAGGKEGKTSTITGSLRLPRGGNDRLPVVILLHGSAGISGFVTDWEQELNEMGIATFVVDSWTGRGITTTVFDQSLPGGRFTQAYDAFRALEVLERHPRIDPARIAVMGFSRGGQAVMVSTMKRVQHLQGANSGREFAAYIALYPTCVPLHEDEAVTARPIRIHHGEADDWVPIAWCREYAQRIKAKGADVVHSGYPGAHHVFDWKALAKPVRIEKAQTTRNCTLQEGTDGDLMNGKSGLPYTPSDPCVEYGVTIAYDEKASVATRRAVKEVLTATLKP
jgi:dienelactone hydrolase